MNSIVELKINWNDSKEKLGEKFSRLGDNDLRFEGKKRYVMLDRIKFKRDNTSEELQVIVYEY